MTDFEIFDPLLFYDPDTGIFTWKCKRGRMSAGAVAGASSSNKYFNISVNRKLYLAHRIAWLLMTKDWPPEGYEIDHINRIKTDNRWLNLRIATRSYNLINSGVYKSNKSSGLRGVNFHYGKWQSAISKNGKKLFLGTFSSKEEAHQKYLEKAKELYGDFAKL